MGDSNVRPVAEKVIEVLVADDHELIRKALRAVIDAETDMHVVAEATDGAEAVLKALKFRPDVVVMDIEMPRLSGIEATRQIKAQLPDVHVLVLTVHDSTEYILQILEAGASGYLTKGVITRDIPSAIRAALDGESTLSQSVLRKLVDYALRYPDRPSPATVRDHLTAKELEILQRAAEGLSNKLIAAQLGLAQNTVKKYMMSIFAKLGVASRTAAVIRAQQLGLLKDLHRK